MIPKHTLKKISLFLAFSILYQIAFPTVAYALTGGPSQAEVQSFEPVGTTQMVDPFTGDFNYNIPLLDVDGYPVNIAYHSGVTMDQEASWVGLGWNLNPGAINRNMRGLPDDFSGGADKVEKSLYMKPTKTTAVTILGSGEFYGKEGWKARRQSGTGIQASYGIGVNYDNYRGLGFEKTKSLSGSIGKVFEKAGLGAGLSGGVGLSSSSKDGLTVTPQMGIRFSGQLPVLSTVVSGSGSMSAEMSINSRSGLKSKTFSKSVSGSVGYKNFAGGASTGVSNSITSFGTQTYTPTTPVRMSNASIAFSGKYSQEINGFTPGVSIIGYHAEQSLAEQYQQVEAFGYMHNEKTNGRNDVLMDFNREKDGSFSIESPNLAIPMNTYDLFSATGHGMAGMFRSFRNDLGMVRDRETVDYSDSKTFNVEFGLGNVFKAGLNRKKVTFTQREGAWNEHNNLKSVMAYQASDHTTNPLYEPSYFKAVGEMTPIDELLIAYSDLKSPIRPKLTKDGEEVSVNQTALIKETNTINGELSSINLRTTRDKREVRNQLMTVKTVAERAFCSQSMITYFTPGAAKTSYGNTIARNTGFTGKIRPDNHITEVSVINPQGTKYVYGIPAYNNAEYNFAFTNAFDPDHKNENGPPKYESEGQVEYDFNSPIFVNPAAGNFTNRKWKGNNHMFECTKVPAYAHSYLLTEIHSPDYREFGESGPQNGASGSYTKLDYYLIKGGANNNDTYKWRVPVKAGRANFNIGYKSVKTDDAANILYGEKEVWLVRSIQGRNHIAYFFISKREDGLGVNGVHGGADQSQRSYKLDSIALYSKKDLTTPIKTVHFEYNYSLCTGVENNSGLSVDKNGAATENPNLNVNQGGKLTLTKIYFTYGRSTKGKFNAYAFTYSTSNPSYNLTGYDRWGNYKKAPTSIYLPTTTEFPYVDQNQTNDDLTANASAWSLTDIVMPSGGKLSVQYEADDYAYVQDRKAMTMYKIAGFGRSNVANEGNNKLYANNFMGADIKYDYIYFKLPDNRKITEADFRNQIIGGSNQNMLYFNCLVNLTSSEHGEKNFEYVKGYAEVIGAGLCTDQSFGWVRVNTVGSFHPIAKSAWQLSQLSLPQKIYPGSDLRNEGSGKDYAIAIIKTLIGFAFEANDLFKGVNTRLENDNFSREVDLSKSWIRLNDVTGFKHGGGCRVKRIEINDNWKAMGKTNAQESIYGQEFDYTLEEDYNGEKGIISSGVASYEPMIGNDENPFRQPLKYTIDNKGIPDYQFYSEEPFGESFFPAAVVGYSQVSVRSIAPKVGGQLIDNSRHRTGKVVYEYFTARDYPTIVKKTALDPHEIRPSQIFTMTRMVDEKCFMGSQGFQIEINDMHGKPKSVFNYSEANINSRNKGEAQSGIEYAYKTDVNNPKELNNEFLVIDRNNRIRTKQVGVESEVTFDSRESKSETYAETIAGNVDFSMIGSFPILSVSIFANHESTISGFKSAVISRVINRYGILTTTTAYQEGATIITENVLLDAETGAVLLTKTQNEFNDYIYNTTYPAHWVNEYDGMGHGYKNVGTVINIEPYPSYGFGAMVNNAIVEPSEYFVNGDECIFDFGGTAPRKCWVLKSTVSGKWMLIDKDGNPLTISGATTVKILSSGRRNMQTATVASISSLQNPIVNYAHPGGAGGAQIDMLEQSSTGVLNASAVEYSEDWKSNFDDYEEAVSQCEDLYAAYDQHQTAMGQEFRDYLVPLIYNQTGFVRTVSTTAPSNNVPLNIAISDINAKLPVNSKLKALIQSYFNCRGIYPDVSCDVTQSTSVQNCAVNGTPSQNITVNRFITINFRVGKFRFAINNYKVSWNATMPTNFPADLKCAVKYMKHCDASTTLNSPVSDGSGLAGITIASGSLPEVKAEGIITVLRLGYPAVSSNTVTFTSNGNPNVTYDVIYTSPYDQTYLNQTDLHYEDFSSNKYICSDNTLNISGDYIGSVRNSIAYNGSITTTIQALLTSKSNNLSDIQKKLYFVWHTSGDYPYIFTTKPVPQNPQINVWRDPNVKPPCNFEFTSIKMNPFKAGIKGNWRESKNWVYVAKRTSPRSTVTDIRKDGTYVAFYPFWAFGTVDPSGVAKSNGPEWVLQNHITQYSKFGGAIESKDALQRYSAQLVNNAGLPIGVANNAKYNQLAFDDMESYDFIRGATASTCPYGHFNFGDNASSKFMLSTDAHTGKQSMMVFEEQEVVEYRPLYTGGGQPVDDANGYMLRKDDLKGQFNPENGTYILSAWVKLPNKIKTATYDERNDPTVVSPFSIQVGMVNASGILVGNLTSLYPSGPIIEGWQKIEGEFTVSNASSATQIMVKLIASKVDANEVTLFDDLRIQPSNASMKTYVYHPGSLRLTAEMDENNYATFYEYDGEGKLVRTKRETHKGIVTIKENKSAQRK